jgi:hypothetical protein
MKAAKVHSAAPSGTTNVARALNLRSCAEVIIRTQIQTTGWTSIGVSIVDGCSVLLLNGTTMTGVGGTITPTHGGQVY